MRMHLIVCIIIGFGSYFCVFMRLFFKVIGNHYAHYGSEKLENKV